MAKQFGDNTKSYPDEMRVQLWPLCCGASILSGFKHVGTMTEDQMVEAINETLKAIPDHQVYGTETIIPNLTYLTLNSGQTQSPKIMAAVKAAGFVKFAEASPRHQVQSFFVRDSSETFKLVVGNTKHALTELTVAA